MSGITERLGNVLYWTANIFAGLSLVGGVVGAVMVYNTGREVELGIVVSIIVGVVFAGACYGAGRACRYILAGK